MENPPATYKLTSVFPGQEIYGLTSQLRSASVSVASNNAEGYGRASSAEYKQFLGMARGSNSEVETPLILATQLGFVEGNSIEPAGGLTTEVGTMLNALMRNL
jgi:four helix bundle protein